MNTPVFAAAALAMITAAPAQSLVFDNTGGLAPLERGILLYGADSELFATGGAQFSAPVEFTLDRVELGLWAIAGVTSVTASLYTDAGNAPATFLASVTISSIGDTAYYGFDFADTYSFTSGTKLWVTVVNATGTLVWNHNAAGIGGLQQQSSELDPTLWNAGHTENPQVAFRVAAIPEPSTSVLLLGICGLAAVVSRARSRSPRANAPYSAR